MELRNADGWCSSCGIRFSRGGGWVRRPERPDRVNVRFCQAVTHRRGPPPLSPLPDTAAAIGDVTAHGVGDVVNQATAHLGDVSHNGTLGDVTSHVGDIASHSGNVSDVHDVVGNIGEGALSGNIGTDLSHLSIGSGNDVHLPH